VVKKDKKKKRKKTALSVMSCSETVQQRPKYQSNLNKTPFNGYEA
jgi:hypothetical protein